MTRTITAANLSLMPWARRAFASLGGMALVLTGLPQSSFAALTDLAQTPIAAGAEVQGKPNIMLLMDTSGSMAWTHMPDEVEKVGAADYRDSIGYRSTQCNSIYYNPAIDYDLPKRSDGTFFPQPSFGAAPYAGFASYFTAADAFDLLTVNLGTSFRAYDGKTTRASFPQPPVVATPFDVGSADPAQPAYYYVYSGPQTLTYSSAACRQPDPGVGTTTVAATGGGTWTRVTVSSTSGRPGKPDELANFATWYSFYRTRLSLIKTAASLAFNPLTDSHRVGFITVEPKTNPNDAAINPSRYVAIADFTPTQRGTWYTSLFSQPAAGASPAREGLARVGRHYAGKQDGINKGMTGDPIQFSCQQNFTIMTTDGYWNSQTETPGGGPVDIDGNPVAVAGGRNPDGTLTPPSGLSPMPIWEGFASDTRVTTDNRNLFGYVDCGAYTLRSTSQASITTTQLTRATSQLVTRTVRTTESTRQLSENSTRVERSTRQRMIATAQTFQTDTQVRQSTTQITASTSVMQQIITQLQQRRERVDRSTSQVQQRTLQTTRSTSRTDRSTLQTRIATSRTDMRTSQNTRTTAQVTQSTSQLNTSTTQTARSTSVLSRSTIQWTQRTSQDRTCDARTEDCAPVATGGCTAAGFFYCETVTTGPTLVAVCNAANAAAGNNYVKTTCTSATTGPTPVASCTSQAATSGNSFTATNCTTATTGPTPVVSCTQSGPTSGNGFTDTTCGTITSAWTPTGSCTTQLPSAGNLYTATNCTTLTTGPTGVASCTPVAATSLNTWTAKTCGNNNTGPAGVSSCTPSSPSSGNGYTTTTCNPVTTGPTAVSSCTPAAAGSGNNWVATTCTPVTTGPTPVASCSPSGATAPNWTTTTCPNVVGTPVAVSSCTPVAATSPSWTATTCTPVNSGPTGVASCAASGPVSPTWTTTTCGTNNTGWTAVASCTTASPASGNAYTTTQCQTIPTGPTPVASCTPTPASSGNAYTNTTCNTVVVQNWTNVGTCTPVAASSANGFVATLCQSVNSAPVAVASCTPSGPNGSGQGVSCNNLVSGPTGVASCTPQTGNSGNGWLTRTCGNNNTGPTLVASCTPSGPTAGNFYTTTTCAPTSVGPTAVASCTSAVAGPGNSFTTRTCNTSTSGPTPTSSCSPIAPNTGNGFTTTSCPDVLTGPTPMPSCAPSGPTSGNFWTDTTCNTINTGPTLVASCAFIAPTAGNNYKTTSCSQVDTGPTPVSSCTQATAGPGNNYVATTCSTTTSPDAGVASCTPSPGTALNGWTETQCATLLSSGGAATCTAQTGNGGNDYLNITCNAVTVGPALTASCTPDVAGSGNAWTSTTCGVVTTGPTLLPVGQTCANEAATAGNNFIETICTSTPGSKVSYATTTTVTTQQYSGPIPVGAPTVNVTNGSATDLDGVCYAPGMRPALPSPNPERAGMTAGPFPPSGCTAWPCTASTANAGGSINSLADVAQYYYMTDLRPGMVDNVTGVGTGKEDDRVKWQHMTTFTVGLGVSGTLNYRSDYKSSGVVTGDFADIRTGAKNWPVWPDPAINYDGSAGGNYANWNNPKSIDDFWHTAVNGRGTYFNAKRPESLVTGLADALADVEIRTGSGSGITVSNATPVNGDNFAFTTTYTTGKWTGNVQGFNLDLSTGAVSTTENWSAMDKLDDATGAACDNRTIYLFRAGAAPGDNKVNFTWGTQRCDGLGNPTGTPDTGLNSTEQAHFGVANVSNLGQYLAMTDGTAGSDDQRTPAVGANLVNYLRGHRGFEGFVPDDDTKLYRARESVLGDVVNGQPAYVKAPFAEYQDAGYALFKSSNAGRVPMLYVPANDGMLHAFYAGTSATDAQGGQEAWAFIPTAVLPNLYKLADTYYRNHHEFFVDGTPVVGDAYDSVASAWKTILVAGLNGGGKSYYALDVTDPANPKALWEFSRSNTCYDGTAGTAGADCHIGYTYGKPVITKLADGTWVVLVTSGYNNVNASPKPGDGEGYLYVLDAFTGRIRHKIGTGVGNPTTPSGLSQINVFVDYGLYNNMARQAYGGDLLGNVWRFDLNDMIAPAGREAALLGIAKDPVGAVQPITVRPELAELGGKPMVFVGTGKLLGASDFSASQIHSVYGIIDTMGPGTVYPGALRNTFRPLLMSTLGASTRTVTCTGSTVQCGSADGWVVDFPLPTPPPTGPTPPPLERVNVQMVLARGTLVFASNIPSDKPCDTGGTSWLNSLSFATGLPVSTSGNVTSTSSFNSLATGVTVLSIGGRLVGDRRFTSAENQPDNVPFDTPPPTGKRISWREIAQ